MKTYGIFLDTKASSGSRWKSCVFKLSAMSWARLPDVHTSRSRSKKAIPRAFKLNASRRRRLHDARDIILPFAGPCAVRACSQPGPNPPSRRLQSTFAD